MGEMNAGGQEPRTQNLPEQNMPDRNTGKPKVHEPKTGERKTREQKSGERKSGHKGRRRTFIDALRPQMRSSHILAGLLCVLLGFALVVQVRSAGADQLANLRQDDLVRLLDEVTTRSDQLEAEVSRLTATRDELASGTDQAQAAMDIAQQRAATEGILSGRLPAQGPGLSMTIVDNRNELKAADMFNILEELRNAGAEAVQVDDIRVVTSTSFVDSESGIMMDGQLLTVPYRWLVIGDPATMDRALEIPGGALPSARAKGASAIVLQEDLVTVTATVTLDDPQFAKPAASG